ncbi:porin [Acidovorax radicis]|uniref:porin n=1 Tax=Acidovorax radicis TaxID=758826 RepID=UPI001CF878BB|nr:porin [Acidovorax radicis]UCU99170.1 porin [Acidovorax radicis]
MKRLGALCAAVASTCVVAQTNGVTLYGIVDLGMRHGSGLTASNAASAGSTDSLGSGINTTSRWGLRGTEDLGGGAKAVFQLESGLNADTGAPANASKYFDRASWLGLQGGWGTLALGRQTTTLADAISPVDPLGMRFAGFNASIGVAALSQHGLGIEFGSAGSTSGSYRLDNAVKYTGRFGGFTARAMLGLGEVASQTSALPSRGLGLAYAAGSFTVSSAFQTFKAADQRTLDGATLGVAYRWDTLRLAANAARSKAETAAGKHTVQRVMSAGATWSITPQTDLTAAYYKVDRTCTGATDDGYGRLVAFAEYKLSRRTKVYAELDNTRWRHGFQGAANQASATGVSAGVMHSF